MKVVYIVPLLFWMNILATNNTEVGAYDYCGNFLDGLVPQRGLTQEELAELDMQIKFWNKVDQIIQQPRQDIENLLHQLMLLRLNFNKNLIKMIKIFDNQEIFNLYFKINFVNFEMYKKLFEFTNQMLLNNVIKILELLQSQRENSIQHEQFNINNLMVSNIFQDNESADIVVDINEEQNRSKFSNSADVM